MKAFFFFWMKPNKFWWLLHEFFLWRTVFFLSSFLGHKFCIRVHSKEIIKIKTAKLLADKYTITTTNHERIHQWIWFLKLMTAHLRKHTTKEWMAGEKISDKCHPFQNISDKNLSATLLHQLQNSTSAALYILEDYTNQVSHHQENHGLNTVVVWHVTHQHLSKKRFSFFLPRSCSEWVQQLLMFLTHIIKTL